MMELCFFPSNFAHSAAWILSDLIFLNAFNYCHYHEDGSVPWICPPDHEKSVWCVLKVFRLGFVLFIPPLCCEGTGEISVLSPGMPSSGGHTVSVVAACGWWGEFSHSTPKEVFCLCRPKLPPWNRCLLKTALREKQKRKESFLKAERRGENIAGFLSDVYSPFKCPLTGGKA